MKIWVDDVRPAPNGYVVCNSVNETIRTIEFIEDVCNSYQRDSIIELIDLDHDAGDYAKNGGDYIKILDWLERTGRNYPIHLHTMNPVGRENMMRIVERNNWKVV